MKQLVGKAILVGSAFAWQPVKLCSQALQKQPPLH